MTSRQSAGDLRNTDGERVRSYSRKRKLDTLMKTTPLSKNKQYKRVEPRLLLDTHKDEIFNKRNLIEERKVQLELNGCTFKPELNNNSLAMTRNNPKVPITEREVPMKYQRALVEELKRTLDQERLQKETETMVLPNNTGKQPNKEFYDTKVAWKKQSEEKLEQARQRQLEEEIGSFIGKPKLNDYSKNKIVPADKLDDSEFLVRVEKTIQKKQENIKNLEGKLYDYPFKPTLYKPRRTGELQL